MKSLSFTNLLKTFIIAIIVFIFTGWIGWVGIILVILKFTNVIHWSWWLAALPLEYGVIYCLYMTIDGARYKAGLKDAGGYARATQPLTELGGESFQIQTIINQGPEHIGETINRLSKIPNRLQFNQTLVAAALEHYYLLQLAMFGNKNQNAHITVKEWRKSGLDLPEEGSPNFS
jgi:hypothetical protein